MHTCVLILVVEDAQRINITHFAQRQQRMLKSVITPPLCTQEISTKPRDLCASKQASYLMPWRYDQTKSVVINYTNNTHKHTTQNKPNVSRWFSFTCFWYRCSLRINILAVGSQNASVYGTRDANELFTSFHYWEFRECELGSMNACDAKYHTKHRKGSHAARCCRKHKSFEKCRNHTFYTLRYFRGEPRACPLVSIANSRLTLTDWWDC